MISDAENAIMPGDDAPEHGEDAEKNREKPGKLGEQFTCNDELILERLQGVFEQEIYIGKLSGLGAGRGAFTCNVLIDNQAVMQMEIRKQQSLDDALYYLRDQERQYLSQLKGFERSIETITGNSFSYYSSSARELRIIYIDADRGQPVVVKLKTLEGYAFENEKLFDVAVELEKII